MKFKQFNSRKYKNKNIKDSNLVYYLISAYVNMDVFNTLKLIIVEMNWFIFCVKVKDKMLFF